jgi:hypothetical protein
MYSTYLRGFELYVVYFCEKVFDRLLRLHDVLRGLFVLQYMCDFMINLICK